jgi:protein-S-isoprenylcysteine O-methyltransferase Ste14
MIAVSSRARVRYGAATAVMFGCMSLVQGNRGPGVRRSVPRWIRNVPLPEPHLVALGVGVAAGAVRGWDVSVPPLVRFAGLGVVGAGAALVTWATRAAVRTHLAEPDRLVVAGPYAFSRNPMYVGWTLGYVGLGLALMNAWLAALLPAVVVVTHLTVRREESRLRDRFGSRYLAYAADVRRYL